MLELALTEDARLRLLEEHDAEELYALIDANRAYLARWLFWAADQTPDDTLEFIRMTRRKVGENNGLETAVVVGGRIAGMVGLHGITWMHGTTSVGYWLAENQQGRGIMTAAVRAYLDYAFHGCGLNRVELGAAVGNARSQALADRVGFTREGVLRQAETIGERRQDIVLYAMLAEDWT